MFQVGDAVSYGTSGVCTIAEKKKVCLAGQPCECYILKPVYDRTMKICVPCNSQVLLERMRTLPSKEEILELLQELLPLGDRRCAGQLIGAELVESAFGFVGTQAGARVYIERLRHLIGIGERRIDVVQQSLLRLHLLGFLGILWFHVGFAGKSGWIYDAIIHSCCSPQSAAE